MSLEPAPTVPEIDAVDQVVLPALRPRGAWYVVGSAVVVLSLAAGFALLTSGAFGYLHDIDDLGRVDTPGTASVRLGDGSVVIYHEPGGGPVAGLQALEVEVLDPEGSAVTVRPASGEAGYAVERRHGVAVGELEAPVAGDYEVTVRGAASGRVAIGPSPRHRLTAFGQAAATVAAVGVIVGIVVLVVTRRRRARSRASRLEQQQASRVGRLA